jgi:hypothetical protein
MMMLGLHLTGEEPFHTVYLSGSSATPKARRCRRRRATSSTRSAVIDETGADALRFARDPRRDAGQDQRFGAAKLENARNFANKLWNATRFVVGARPRRSPTSAGAAARRAPLGPPSAGCARARRATRSRRRRRWPSYAFGEVHATAVRRDLERVLRLGCRARQGRSRTSRCRRRPAMAGRGGRSSRRLDTLPAAAPSGDAVRDRSSCGARPRIVPAIPACLIVARWPAPTAATRRVEAEVGSIVELIRGLRQRPCRVAGRGGPGCPPRSRSRRAMGPTFERSGPRSSGWHRARPARAPLRAMALGQGSGSA